MEHYKNKSLENIVELIDGVLVTESWKEIKGYEGLYMISDFGRVKSLERLVGTKNGKKITIKEKIVSQQLCNGYLTVKIHLGSRQQTRFAHRLVAQSFIENPENKRTVNHKKGIKTDNRVWFLEWNTHKENTIHAFEVLGRKVTPHEGVKGFKNKNSKPIICINTREIYGSIREAANKLGVKSHRSISAVLRGEHKECYGLVFKFLSDYKGDETIDSINHHLKSRREMIGENNPMYNKLGFDSVNGKIVLDTETGIFYGCAREAAEAKNIKYSTMKSMLNGRYKNKTSLLYA